MTQQLIDVGAVANDRTGDTWREAFIKVNANETELFASTTNTILVKSAADLPAASGGTHTLLASTVYQPQGVIDLGGNTLTLQADTVLRGRSPAVDGFSTTSGSALFSGPALRVRCLSATCPNGPIFNKTDDASEPMFFIEVNCFSFGSYGTIGTSSGGLLQLCNFIGPGGGMMFTGGTGNFGIQNSLFSGYTGNCIDLSTFVFNVLSMDTVIFSGAVASTALSGLASSGNIGTRGVVSKCSFNGSGAALSGIDEQDLKWDFTGNFGVARSRNAADGFLLTTETVIIGTIGQFEEVGGTSFSSSILDRFTISTSGVLTYVGIEDIEIQVSGFATVQKVGGGSDVLVARFAKNWVSPSSGIAQSGGQSENATPTSIPLVALIDLTTGDTIRVIVANSTTTANIEVDLASIVISE